MEFESSFPSESISFERTLDEIPSESLEQFLNSTRSHTAPLGTTHIAALDAHLASTASLHVSSLSSINRGDVLEIQGPPSSGKSHLVYHLICNCILPSVFSGWNKAAIVYDLDRTFDITRLRQLLRSRISAHTTHVSDLPTAISNALRNLRIFAISSSTQLAASLAHLPIYHAEHLPTSEIALIAIDSMSAFYWPDRFSLENITHAPPPHAHPQTPSDHHPLHQVLKALQNVRRSHGSLVAMTNWGLLPRTNGPVYSTSYKQHLHPFPVLAPPTALPIESIYLPLTHQITLNRAVILPFPSSTALEDAWHEAQHAAQNAIHEKIIGRVRSSRTDRVGTFSFKIGPDDMIVQDAQSHDTENMEA
ncbi:P-loop containing nucleoside triphosphate hydrolase protein [Amylostereum chailletii]|nr:P-loop containing nucleoside triphosphate hydrolase protein [Amylostereum chailletii]